MTKPTSPVEQLGRRRLGLGFELRRPVAERLEQESPEPRNTPVDSTRSAATPHGAPAGTHAGQNLVRHRVVLTRKIAGENRSRPRPQETSVREMDALPDYGRLVRKRPFLARELYLGV